MKFWRVSLERWSNFRILLISSVNISQLPSSIVPSSYCQTAQEARLGLQDRTLSLLTRSAPALLCSSWSCYGVRPVHPPPTTLTLLSWFSVRFEHVRTLFDTSTQSQESKSYISTHWDNTLCLSQLSLVRFEHQWECSTLLTGTESVSPAVAALETCWTFPSD